MLHADQQAETTKTTTAVSSDFGFIAGNPISKMRPHFGTAIDHSIHDSQQTACMHKSQDPDISGASGALQSNSQKRRLHARHRDQSGQKAESRSVLCDALRTGVSRVSKVLSDLKALEDGADISMETCMHICLLVHSSGCQSTWCTVTSSRQPLGMLSAERRNKEI